MSETVIEASHLDLGYQKTKVLHDANFKIHSGEIVAVLGGSGCGKTTLMMTLIGLKQPLAGQIKIKGMDITDQNHQSKQWLKQHIGVMFQSGALFSAFTLLENVMLPLQEHTSLPQELIEQCALTKLRLVGLGNSIHYYPAEISGGMIKRAAIARAMALDPSIIFLDEPSAGLDPITRMELDQLIFQLSRDFGITFVIITHELDTITSIADRGIVLHNQSIIADGPISTIAQQKTPDFIQQFFHCNPRTTSS